MRRKATPRPIIDKLNEELRKAVRSSAVQTFLTSQSLEAITDTPEEFKAFFDGERRHWTDVIKAAGVTAN